MATLARFVQWGAIVLAVIAGGTDIGWAAMTVVVAFIPPVAAWARETLRAGGVSTAGPSRESVLVIATAESVVGAFCIPMALIMPDVAIGLALLLVVVGASDLLGRSGVCDATPEPHALRIREGENQVDFTWPSLEVRRKGPFFLFKAEDKQLEARFGSGFAEDLARDVQARGARFTSVPFVGWGMLVPFMAAAAASGSIIVFVRDVRWPW